MTDPWELLREARETLLAQHDPQNNSALANRIDAALDMFAAPVEWSNPYPGFAHIAYVSAASVTVKRHRDGGWSWRISQMNVGPTEGHARTEEEAKAVAIATARMLQ